MTNDVSNNLTTINLDIYEPLEAERLLNDILYHQAISAIDQPHPRRKDELFLLHNLVEQVRTQH